MSLRLLRFPPAFLVLGAALADDPPPRPAAEIASDKAAADTQLAAASGSPADSSPLATDNGDDGFSLLGVRSGVAAISSETVRIRTELWEARKKLQPQIDEKEQQKKGYDAEISKLDDKISALEKQRSDAIDHAETDEAKDSIRRSFAEQIDAVHAAQDDFEKQKNDVDDAIDKLNHSPEINAASHKFEVQLQKDARHYFSADAAAPSP